MDEMAEVVGKARHYCEGIIKEAGMKEYRIKARSADHRRAIIGAMEGMGFVWPHCTKDDKGNMEYPFVVVYPDEERADGRSEATPTHTSLDSLLEDIERDRKTVEVKFSARWIALVRPDGIVLKDDCGAYVFVIFPDFDRIAAAVKQVRGE